MKETIFNINEIFYSIEGEGQRAGLPCVFVRFSGCNLDCSYCDTKYACETKEQYSLVGLLDKIRSYECPNITLTGGEPLLQEGYTNLVYELLNEDFWVNTETNGSIDIPLIPNIRAFFTMDWKTPSSGQHIYMKEENLGRLFDCDVLKFVVGNREDLEYAEGILHRLDDIIIRREKYSKQKDSEPAVFFSPVWGKIELKEIAEFLKEKRLNAFLGVQLHKLIWGPDAQGV